jgi:hypothetical protein
MGALHAEEPGQTVGGYGLAGHDGGKAGGESVRWFFQESLPYRPVRFSSLICFSSFFPFPPAAAFAARYV